MSTNIIKMNRGDDYEFSLSIDDGSGQEYKLVGNDTIYFSLMEPNAPFECPLIGIKISANGTIQPAGHGSAYIDEETGEMSDISIKLLSDDTVNLLPGVYYYSVKLQQDHQEPDDANITIKSTSTIINKTKFIILD